MILLHSRGAHSGNSVASANCYYYRSSFQDRNGKALQTYADDSPRLTNGTPAETAADAIPHDKMHTRETPWREHLVRGIYRARKTKVWKGSFRLDVITKVTTITAARTERSISRI
ncbi:hypothetical protein PUN28_003415 [Cardiocondyla obscurior]|uniref:Uncharacterized protein n=1 Tax=Cardiocondyla obscurior TaxID=286306 RepID=A0AAW2GKU8_9HYME